MIPQPNFTPPQLQQLQQPQQQPMGQPLMGQDPHSQMLAQALQSMGQHPQGNAQGLDANLLAAALDQYSQQKKPAPFGQSGPMSMGQSLDANGNPVITQSPVI